MVTLGDREIPIFDRAGDGGRAARVHSMSSSSRFVAFFVAGYREREPYDVVALHGMRNSSHRVVK